MLRAVQNSSSVLRASYRISVMGTLPKAPDFAPRILLSKGYKLAARKVLDEQSSWLFSECRLPKNCRLFVYSSGLYQIQSFVGSIG
jgi:hypothetical protein